MSIEAGPSGVASNATAAATSVRGPSPEGSSARGIHGPSITIGKPRSHTPSSSFRETVSYHAPKPSPRDNTAVKTEHFASMPTIWQRNGSEPAVKPKTSHTPNHVNQSHIFEPMVVHVAEKPTVQDHKPKEEFQTFQAQPSASLYERPKPITQPKNAYQTPGVRYSQTAVLQPQRQHVAQFRQRIHEMVKQSETRATFPRRKENNQIKPKERPKQDIQGDAKPKSPPVKMTSVEQRLQTVRQELQHIATTKPENAKTQVVHRAANSPQTKEYPANVFATPAIKEQPKPEVVTQTKTLAKQTQAMTHQRSSSVHDAPSRVGTVVKVLDVQPQTQETVMIKVTSTSVGYLERLRKAGVIDFFKKKVTRSSLPNSGVVIEKEDDESRKREIQHDVPVNKRRAEILYENAQEVLKEKQRKDEETVGKDLVVENDALPPSGLAVERDQEDYSIPRIIEHIAKEGKIYSLYHAKKKVEAAIMEFPGVKNDEPKYKQASKEEIENVINEPVTIFEVQTKLTA